MKHVKVLSVEKPAKAEEVAWIQLKDLIATNQQKAPGAFVSPTGNMTQAQAGWLVTQWDNWLQK